MCLNCQAQLHGPFCSTCGQRAVPPHPTVRELAGDALAELSGWDGKLAASFRTLLLKPGELTLRWIEGRRLSFISPLRMYLTASLLYFGITAIAPNLRGGKAGDVNISRIETTSTAAGRTSEAIRVSQPLVGAERDSALADVAKAPAIIRPMMQRAIEDPAGFQSSVRRTMANVFLGLIPVLGLVLSLFYRRRNYPEHLYFAIHLAAFVFVARTLGNATLFIGSIPVAAVAQALMLIWIVAYGVIALRRVYGGSVGMTILKGIGVCLLYGIVAAPVVVAAALIAASL